MSSVDGSLTAPLQPHFVSTSHSEHESADIQTIIDTLQMLKHPEGGYFVETDRDARTVPNPFVSGGATDASASDRTRSASTTIYYLITPRSSFGAFHRNKARTVHTLHQGRGRYVIVHADEAQSGQKARIETFVVGHDLTRGEKLQWIVEGGKYKASYLLPDTDGGSASSGLLISETVVPGFEFSDHSWMTTDIADRLLTAEQSKELSWLLNRS